LSIHHPIVHLTILSSIQLPSLLPSILLLMLSKLLNKLLITLLILFTCHIIISETHWSKCVPTLQLISSSESEEQHSVWTISESEENLFGKRKGKSSYARNKGKIC
jgi:hypothetical protein